MQFICKCVWYNHSDDNPGRGMSDSPALLWVPPPQARLRGQRFGISLWHRWKLVTLVTFYSIHTYFSNYLLTCELNFKPWLKFISSLEGARQAPTGEDSWRCRGPRVTPQLPGGGCVWPSLLLWAEQMLQDSPVLQLPVRDMSLRQREDFLQENKCTLSFLQVS